jgi:peptide/nickel transport system substrate-binding protein
VNEISRRDFLRMSALAAAGVAVVACAKTAEPTPAPDTEPTPTPKPAEPTPTPVPEKPALQESPMLSDMVAAGKIPPLGERLPATPFLVRHGVLMPEEELDFEIGKLGGTLRSVHNRVGWNPDVFVMCNESLLMGPGLTGANLRGGILEGFEASSDSLTFTFHMRKGLKWSDGEPVTTDDIRFAYEDVLMNEDLTPAFPSWLRSGNTATGEPMKLEVLDAYTYRVTFDQAYGGFDVQMAIVGWRGYTDFLKPKHYMQAWHTTYTKLEDLEPLIQKADLAAGEWWSLFPQEDHTNWEHTRPTSIGFPALTPWVMVEESPTAEKYDRNPYYFKTDESGQQLPYIDKLDDRLVENVETIVMSVMAGEVDFLYEAGAMPSVPVYKDNEEKGGYNTVLLRSHTEPATVYINMTYEDKVWRQVVRDIRFRQALNLSLNRQEIIDTVWLGFGAELPEHIPNEYDADQANKLLDEIGLDQRDDEGFRLGPDGNTFEIPFEIANRTPEMLPTAELVVEYFNAVGLKTTMKTIDNSLRAQRSSANELMATTQPNWWQRHTGWYMPREWGRLWEVWRTSGGESGEEPPPEVKEFLELAAKTMVVPPQERQGLIDQLDALLYENIFFMCPVEMERRPIIASKKLGNVAHEGFSIGACFGGEQFFYKE